MKIDTSVGPSAAFTSAFARDRDLALYPQVTGMDTQTVEAHLTSGVVYPMINAAELRNHQKQQEVYNEVITTSALDGRAPEEALAELEGIIEDNTYLKAFISPAVLAMFKQSDNPVAQRAAERRIVNVFMAADLIQAKTTEVGTGLTNGAFDLIDSLFSDLPIRSAMTYSDRVAMAKRFVQVLDSPDDPAVVKAELDKILTEAADQGFFTQANRFYLNDFLTLATEGTEDAESYLQAGFAALDVLAGIPAAADVAYLARRGLTKASASNISTDAARLTAFTTGDEKAVKEILDTARAKDDPLNSATSVSNKQDSLSTPLAARGEDLTPSEATAARFYEVETKAMLDAIDIRLTSGFSIDEEGFEIFANRLAKEAKDTAEKTGNLRLLDSKVSIADAFENIIQTDVLGTKKGKAFTSEKAAQKFADQIGGAKVVPVAGTKKQFVVHKINNVATGEFSQGARYSDVLQDTQLYRSTDTEDLGLGFFAHFGSPLSQTTTPLNAVLKQAEAARSKAMAILDKDIIPVLKKVGRAGRDAVERVFLELRDGSLASRRAPLTASEFENYFYTLNKRLPSADEIDTFIKVQHRNNVDWYLSADAHFKRAVNRGVEMLHFNNTDNAVQKITKAPEGSMVWDDDLKKFVKSEDIGPDKQMYRLVEPVDFGGKYADMVVTNVPKTRAVRHDDVFGYNVGGSRIAGRNQNNWFIKQSNEITLADGRTREVTPTAIMVAKTELEASRGVDLINKSLKALQDAVGIKSISKKDYYTTARAKIGDKKLDDLIAESSDWNPSVHSVATLIDFFEEMGLDMRRLVDKAADGEPLVKDVNSLVGDITFKDVNIAPGIIRHGDMRRDKALRGFGDKELNYAKPLDAIQRSFSSSVAKSTEAAYAAMAINGVLRSAMEKGLLTNLSEIRNLSLRQKLRNATFLTGSRDGKKLELERQKIMYRLDKKNLFDAAIAKQKDALANWFYDKGYKRGSDVIDALSSEPIAAMRGITFDLMLGMFAFDQAWVQAAQISNVIGMSKGTSGVRGVASMPVVRSLIMNGNPDIIRRASQHAGPAVGMTPEHFADMVASFMQSGRGMVQASLADLGEDSAGKVILGKLRSAGRVFYNEGELAARISAHAVASIEYLSRNPAGSLLSRHAKRYVAHEADKFTNAMTSMSRNAFEQLPMFQFMSYTMRMAEFMLAGIPGFGGKKILTGRQKLKLGSTQVALYGISAVPIIGYQLDYFNFKYGQEWNQETVETFRNGALDAVIEWMTGVETEVGRRLAWGEGVFQLMQSLSEDSIFQVAGGPTASWVENLSNSLFKLAYNIKVGGTAFVASDLVDVARTVKSVNISYNAYMAFKAGEYHSRSGTKITDDISWGEAWAIALGVPLEELNAVWNNISFLANDKEYFKHQGKMITQLFARQAALDDPLSEEGRVIRLAIGEALAIHDPFELQQILRYVDYSAISLSEQIWFDALRANRNPK